MIDTLNFQGCANLIIKLIDKVKLIQNTKCFLKNHLKESYMWRFDENIYSKFSYI